MPVTPIRKSARIIGPPARRGAAAVAALALAAGGAAGCKDLTAGPTQVKQQDQTYQHSISRIEFAVQSGKVSLSPGSDGTVAVHRTLTYDQSEPTVSETWSGSTLKVSATCPDSGRCSVDYSVTVPASVEVQMNDGTGDVSVQNLTGPVDVTLGTGNVELAALTGRVRVDTQTGTIDGTALQSADVQLTGITGDVSADFAKAPATVQAVTTTGRVHVAVPQGTGGYRVQAAATTGKVTVSVPQETSSQYSIIAKATTGDVSVD